MDIKIPDSVDDDWLREQLGELRNRVEQILNGETDIQLLDGLNECLEIIDALQQYTGY